MGERSGLFLAVAVLATALTYHSIPAAYFVGDDFLHLFAIIDADRYEYLLRPHGGHLLLTRNAVFVAFYEMFGVNAEPYYVAALLTHLVNTGLLFGVIRNWTASAPLAALGALLWGTCPVHAATLQWYSVYGQVLAALILLAILYQGSRRERADMPLPRWIIIGWPLLFIIGSTCFGVGIGLLLAAPVALLFVLPISRPLLITCAVLAVIAYFTPTIYRALVHYHAALSGNGAEVWNMYIALATLNSYVRILTMFGYLISAGISKLLLSFAAASTTFPSAASWCATAVYTAAVIATLIGAPARARARIIGLLLFASGCYGIISAGRATLRAATVAVPRYHYVGTILLSIVLCCCLAQLTRRLRRTAATEVSLLVGGLLVGAVLYFRSEPFINLHHQGRNEADHFITQIRSRVAEAPAGREVHIVNRRFAPASGGWLPNPRNFPGWAGAFVLYFPSNIVDGKSVKFVVDDPDLIKSVAKGKRTRDLFILGDKTPPEQAPVIHRRTL